MNRKDKIYSFLCHYFEVAWSRAGATWDADNRAEMGELAALLVVREPDPYGGEPGTGVCICGNPPEKAEEIARGWNEPFERYSGKLVLDHRCPRHGERAQPKLWGRHKTLELAVSPREWISLGVTYPEYDPTDSTEARRGGPENG